jgi:hypothetical protein
MYDYPIVDYYETEGLVTTDEEDFIAWAADRYYS